MKSVVLFILLFHISASASEGLKFSDTEVNFSKPLKFEYLANMNAFVADSDQGRVTVIRKTPELPGNIKSVQRFWATNLKNAGLKEIKGECKEVSKRNFQCMKVTAEKNHYLSWSKEDLIYILAINKKSEILKPDFQYGKIKK